MGNRTETFIVEKSLPDERLDNFLHARYPVVSRGTIQRLIAEGHITLNGATVKAKHSPRAGESIRVYWPEARPSETQPEDIPLNVLFEDDDLLVVNKPPDLVVHPASGHDEHTLVNALLHHCRGQLSGIGGVRRPGIVHRLDKETSGCMVVAKNDATHQSLAAQFAGREIQKVYNAILCGVLGRDQGEVRAAIGRHPTHRKRMTVLDGSGRDAWTSYRVLEHWSAATLVEVLLHTGRTHQIRVHFQFISHPLAGDLTYGKRQDQRLYELTGYRPPRVMLHSHRLTFTHPRSGETKTIEAPWPDDFAETVAALRGKA